MAYRLFVVSTSMSMTKVTKNNTCRFVHDHFAADFDYDGLHVFDTSLSITFQPQFNYTGRDVVHQSWRFELQSPNSCQLLVYPGLPPPYFQMSPPLCYPHTDGSVGRFDWTLQPQYLNTNQLHFPFIVSPQAASNISPPLPEFMYLTLV